jgi:hypothetical protein
MSLSTFQLIAIITIIIIIVVIFITFKKSSETTGSCIVVDQSSGCTCSDSTRVKCKDNFGEYYDNIKCNQISQDELAICKSNVYKFECNGTFNPRGDCPIPEPNPNPNPELGYNRFRRH